MTRPSHMPADTPDEMAPAWASCLVWSAGEPEILAQFRKETGTQWSPGTTVLEQMIDESTGAAQGWLLAYVERFNANVWGPMDGTGP